MSARARLVIAAAVAVAAAVIAIAACGGPKATLHAVDERWLDERLKDAYARATTHEDWSQAERLHRPQDYAWLDEAPPFVRIGHALGESGTAGANTLPALERSRRAGLRLFEVDVSLDDGMLRCEHDLGEPATAGSCSFATLLEALPRDGGWLVLDIKTNFAETGRRVVDVLRREGRARQVIFQLYQPGDLALFNAWQAQVDLAGPIVTAYLAGRSIHQVADAAQRAGVRALTVPTWRLPALRAHPAPPALQLFTHPVHDCAAWQEARAARVRGIYTLSGLSCPDAPAGPSIEPTR